MQKFGALNETIWDSAIDDGIFRNLEYLDFFENTNTKNIDINLKKTVINKSF